MKIPREELRVWLSLPKEKVEKIVEELPTEFLEMGLNGCKQPECNYCKAARAEMLIRKRIVNSSP